MLAAITVAAGVILGAHGRAGGEGGAYDAEDTSSTVAALSDRVDGVAAFRARLAAAITVADGLIMVRQGDRVFALPVASPWTIACGLGLTLHLGAAATGFEGEVESLVAVRLADFEELDDADCPAAASLAGRAFLLLLGQNHAAVENSLAERSSALPTGPDSP